MKTYIVHVSSRSNALYKFKNDLFYSLRLLVKETNLAMCQFRCDTDEASTVSSQASCHSVPENEISIWSDEVQVQQEKRKVLNDTVQTLTDGQTSPILSTLNTTWDDISSTQQNYYQRKAKETIMAALSVISPGQEEKLRHAVRKEATIGSAQESSTRRKSFDPSSPIIDSLVKAYEQATSWQTKRQILSIFANDFTRARS